MFFQSIGLPLAARWRFGLWKMVPDILTACEVGHHLSSSTSVVWTQQRPNHRLFSLNGWADESLISDSTCVFRVHSQEECIPISENQTSALKKILDLVCNSSSASILELIFRSPQTILCIMPEISIIVTAEDLCFHSTDHSLICPPTY